MREYLFTSTLRVRAKNATAAAEIAARYEARRDESELVADPDDDSAVGVIRSDRSDPVLARFEAGDFIWWNDGPTEMSFGTVVEQLSDEELEVTDARDESVRTILMGNVAGLTTKTEWRKYDRGRGKREKEVAKSIPIPSDSPGEAGSGGSGAGGEPEGSR